MQAFQSGQKMTCENNKRSPVGVFIYGWGSGVGAGHCEGLFGLNLLLALKARAPMLAYPLSQMKVTRAGGKLKAVRTHKK